MLAARRESANTGWTSIVFPPGRVEVAKLRLQTDQKPTLEAWDSYALETGPLEALKRLRQSKRIGGGQCTTLLSHGQYQLLQVEAPDVAKPEMREAVRWRIKEMVEFPVEQAVVDVLELPTPQGGGRSPQVFVVAAAKDKVAPRIHLFQEAKLPLAAIDIPELALRNIAALLEQQDRGLALLAFDGEGGRLVFTYQGELLASRFIDVKRDDLAAASATEGGLFERVLLEVQRSLDNFERAHSYATLARLLVAALPGGSAFVDYLKGNLYQPVETLDLAQVIDLSVAPALADPVRQAEGLLSIGSALRDEAARQ